MKTEFKFFTKDRHANDFVGELEFVAKELAKVGDIKRAKIIKKLAVQAREQLEYERISRRI